MEIRTATSNDCLALSKLCRDVQSLHAEHHPQLFKMPQSDDFASTFFDEMLADPEVTIYIAEDDGCAMGYVMCKLIDRPETVFTYSNRFLLIDQISVRPEAQRTGIGTALLRQAETCARDWGLAKIQLDSWDFNLDAHIFFEKYGFHKFNHRFWLNL